MLLDIIDERWYWVRTDGGNKDIWFPAIHYKNGWADGDTWIDDDVIEYILIPLPEELKKK